MAPASLLRAIIRTEQIEVPAICIEESRRSKASIIVCEGMSN